jgi:hypothetical protein
VSVTSTPASIPAVPPVQSNGPARSRTPPADAAPAQPVAAAAPEASAPPVPAAIGFSLVYDAGSGRMILEALEPDSGFVIYQMPPKYVIKQFTASVAPVDAARGATVDSAA